MSRVTPATTHHVLPINSSMALPAMLWTLISCELLLVRMVMTGSSTFLFLIWNLFLAWIPFVISIYILHKRHHFLAKPIAYLALAAIWLVFLPNAPYIITDLIHLKHRAGVPIWFDAIMLLSFALNGLQIGLFSLSHIHVTLFQVFGKKFEWLLVSGILYLTSFGVFLGRVLRWNSWDLVTNPISVIKDVIHFLNPIEQPKITAISLSSTIVLLLLYVTLQKFSVLTVPLKQKKK